MPRTRKEEFTTIGIRKETRDRLKELGKKGELYDDILNDLIDMVRGRGRKGKSHTFKAQLERE